MEFSLLHDWIQNFLKAIIQLTLDSKETPFRKWFKNFREQKWLKVMFVFIFFSCSLKTVVSKISAGFSKCGCELGGSVPVKVSKSSCPWAGHIHQDLCSVTTSSRDDHCFVLKEGDFWICLHPECQNLHAMSFQVTGLWSLHVCTLNSSLIAWMLVEDSLLVPKKLLPTHLILKRRSCWRLWLSLLVITMPKR